MVTPAIGTAALVVAVASAVVGVFTRRRAALVAVAGALAVSTLALVWAMVTLDLSLAYVEQHTTRSTPWPHRIAGTWGGMGGSLLVWTTMLATVTTVATRAARRAGGRTLVVVACATAGSLGAATLLFSNPFAATELPTVDGIGLNPILRHPAMLYHPPLLYLGQVLLVVGFASALAARGGEVAAHAAIARRALLMSWCVLVVAMAAGAHWAYAELGWGGWWAWDPVEDAALLPWLGATAGLHTGRRPVRVLQAAAAAWCLALLGAWLARSGAASSVHAFAEARSIGWVLAGLLVVSIAASVWGLRPLRDACEPDVVDDPLLRVASAAALWAAIVVTFGTVVPLAFDLAGQPIAVDGRFFARFVAPSAVAVVLFAGIAHRRGDALHARARAAAVGLSLAATLGIVAGVPLVRAAGMAVVGASAALLVPALRRATGRRAGGVVAHLGALVLIGGLVASGAAAHRQAVLRPGDSLRAGGVNLTLRSIRPLDGDLPGTAAVIDLGGSTLQPSLVLHPGAPALAETATDRSLRRDVLVALRRVDAETATVEVWVRPLVWLVWIGALLIALGGAVALATRRRVPEAAAAASPESSPSRVGAP